MQKKCIHPILILAKKKFCLSLHYNGSDSYLFFNGKVVTKCKAKHLNVFNVKYLRQMCLGNISSNFDQKDRKSAGIYGYVYDFSVDYWAIVPHKILDINKYLMKKNNII